MIDLRLRSFISDQELDAKVGKILTPGDYNVVLTGAAKVRKPDGSLLAVFLPGALDAELSAAFDVLSSIKVTTDNRGLASGTPRERRGEQKRTRTRRIISGTIGAVDPGPSTTRIGGRLPVCRLTAWTGKHADRWVGLRPVFQAIAQQYAEHVPDRYAVQLGAAAATPPEWVIPGTPFTTVTVNNTYSTGLHTDSGDLAEGFSTLAVARRGVFEGGLLVLARYRLAVEMGHGDLLLFDAHEWHGNTAMRCPHVEGDLARPCPQGCERVSLVSYFRTKVQQCGTAEQELAKAQAVVARHAG